MKASLVLLALACAGCSAARADAPATTLLPPAHPPSAPALSPSAPVRAQIPGGWSGTWTSADGAAFLAIVDDQVVLNLPGLPRRAARIATVVSVGTAAAVTLDDGTGLVLAVGRATGERMLGGITFAADRAVLDVGIASASASPTVRLWGEGSATWLPLAGLRGGGPSETTADQRLLAAAGGEPLLQLAVQEVMQRARSGAAPSELDAVWSEHARRVRLAALDRLEALAGAADALDEADRMAAALATCSEAYGAWRAGRG